MKPKPGDITMVIRPMPQRHGEADAAQRLRRLLKCVLRSFGFRCIDIRGTLPPIDPDLDTTKTDPPFAPRPSPDAKTNDRATIDLEAISDAS